MAGMAPACLGTSVNSGIEIPFLLCKGVRSRSVDVDSGSKSPPGADCDTRHHDT